MWLSGASVILLLVQCSCPRYHYSRCADEVWDYRDSCWRSNYLCRALARHLFWSPVHLPDSLSESVLDEVARFWRLGDRYVSIGFLHRRGYLFHGAQGTGKSCIIHQIVADVIRGGNIALFCQHPHWFLKCAEQLRRIEPTRPIVCVFEGLLRLLAVGIMPIASS